MNRLGSERTGIGSHRTGLVSIRTGREAGCDGDGGGGGGPVVPSYMSIRQETATSSEFPIEVFEGNKVANWPNRLGSALDSIVGAFPAPYLVEEEGVPFPFVRFNGAQTLIQRSPGVGAFSPPVSPSQLAPFHIFVVARCGAELGTTRAVIAGFPLNAGGEALIFCPVDGWTFRLAWQYKENATSNIATVSNVGTLFLGKWCLFEWICDGPTLRYLINGNEIALDNHNPIGVTLADEVVGNYLGSTIGAGVRIDMQARYVYKEALPPEAVAQTRAYLLTTYPVDP